MVKVLAGALLLLGLVVASAGADDGAVFRAHCANCHGETGLSDTPAARALKVAPLAGHPGLVGMTPAEIVRAVRASPKHAGVVDLTDADLAGAAVYVRKIAAQPLR